MKRKTKIKTIIFGLLVCYLIFTIFTFGLFIYIHSKIYSFNYQSSTGEYFIAPTFETHTIRLCIPFILTFYSRTMGNRLEFAAYMFRTESYDEYLKKMRTSSQNIFNIESLELKSIIYETDGKKYDLLKNVTDEKRIIKTGKRLFIFTPFKPKDNDACEIEGTVTLKDGSKKPFRCTYKLEISPRGFDISLNILNPPSA